MDIEVVVEFVARVEGFAADVANVVADLKVRIADVIGEVRFGGEFPRAGVAGERPVPGMGVDVVFELFRR